MSKQHFINSCRKLRNAFPTDMEWADLNLAYIIMDDAHDGETTLDQAPYFFHPLHVAEQFQDDPIKVVLALLHDVVESKLKRWSLDDLRAVGFSERIVAGVDALTRRRGLDKSLDEPYFDFIERLSLNTDAIDVKIADMKHNLDESRNRKLPDIIKVMNNISKYKISIEYLEAVKAGKVQAGSSIIDFIRQDKDYGSHPDIENIIAQNSSFGKNRVALLTPFPITLPPAISVFRPV